MMIMLPSPGRFHQNDDNVVQVRRRSAIGNSLATNLTFHETPKYSTTVRGSKFREIREKAGLSKTGLVTCCYNLLWSSCKVVTKDHSIPGKPTHHVATIFCNHLAKLLQKIRASQKNQHIMLLLSFVIILQSCYKRSEHPRKPNTSHHMLLLSFVIILQSCYKRSEHPRKPTHHVATIFCNHLAKLLQKIIASQKNQPITCCYYLL